MRRSRLHLTEWEDLHKAQFLNAIDIVLAALSEHILRFARLARNMAQCETRDGRRTELLAIADNCDLIAHRPPRTFWQALQLCYFIQLTLQIESTAIRFPSADLINISIHGIGATWSWSKT